MEDAREVPLLGGNLTRVVRVGSTVRRAAGPWTPRIHELLRHVRANGFALAPEPLGLDDSGREMLAYIPGETAAEHPWPGWVWSDQLLVDAARSLRAYHAAVSDFRPLDLESRLGRWTLSPEQIVCHNDFAPYNCVVKRGRIVGVIDWDVVCAGRPEWDLAFLLWQWVPLHGPSTELAWRSPEECVRRLRLILEQYGPFRSADLVGEVMERIESSRHGILKRAEAGDEDFLRLLGEGHADEMGRALDFVESIRPALTRAVSESG